MDLEKRRVEIMCPNCGKYELSREQFDQAIAEDAELQGPEVG
jgi:hypothetical protein